MANMAFIHASEANPGRYVENDEEEKEDEPNMNIGPSMNIQRLTEALTLLTEFATLDSGTYQSSFSAQSPKQQQQYQCDAADENHRKSLRRLEHLLKQHDVQSTPLPALWRALHRLHSNLAILQENEAHNVNEVNALRDNLMAANQSNTKLKKAVKLLTDRNASLERKLQRKQCLLKQARDFFRNSQETQKDLEQQNTVFKMQFHEQFLLQSNRERLESTDSNFSDADALLFPDTVAPASSCRGLEEDMDSLHSSSSLITDEGVAVVKLFSHHDDAVTMVSTTVNSSHHTGSCEFSESLDDSGSPGGPLNHPGSPWKPGVYKIWYPQGQKVGLRFHTIPLQDLPVPPRGSLTPEILKDDAESEEESRKQMFRLPNILVKLPAQVNSTSTAPEVDEGKLKGHAILVSAYVGAETNADQLKPTLGARVVEINGEAVDPSWSLNKFYSVLSVAAGVEVSERRKPNQGEPTREEGGAPQEIDTDGESSVVSSIDETSKVPTFSIGFRNDALSKKQRERLSSSDRFDSSGERQRERMNSTDRLDSKEFEQLKEPHSYGIETKQPMGFGMGFLRGVGNSARNISHRTMEGVMNPVVQNPEDRKSPCLNLIPEGQAMKVKQKDESQGASDKALSSAKEISKGKNPLFFWDRGDNKSTIQVKGPEVEENEVEFENAGEGDNLTESEENKEVEKPAAVIAYKSEVDRKDTSEVPLSLRSLVLGCGTGIENQAPSGVQLSSVENTKKTDVPVDAKDSNPKQEAKKEASNKKPPRGPMMGIPFWTPPKRTSPKMKLPGSSEISSTLESQPDGKVQTEELKQVLGITVNDQETPIAITSDEEEKPVGVAEVDGTATDPNLLLASGEKRMFGVPFWRTSPKPLDGNSSTLADQQVKPLL